jgi:hypothetical protein
VVINKRQLRDGDTLALAGKCIGSVDLAFCLLHPLKAIPVWASDGARRPLPTFYSFHPFCMATANKTPVAPATNKPVQAFRMRGISVAVFANLVARKNGNGKYPVHNISLQRTYRDGDDYKTTSVFRRDDLPILQRLLQQAWDYIFEVESDQAPEEEPE